MMIRHVTRETFTAADVPQKFEAGTPPITEAVGLHAAIDWLTQFRWAEIEQHEQSLIATAYTELQSNPRIQILGSQNPLHVSGCISFVVDGAHPHDLTDILGKRGICLRAGHHCAQPLHQALGVQASTRLSIGLPTATSDIQAASASLRQTIGQLD
jgi:cysteine desulfurase/selenocysteine lyase